MSPERLLSQLSRSMQQGASEHRGGLLLVRVDRAPQLREQFGFTGLFKLLDRVGKRLESLLSGGNAMARLDPATRIVLIEGCDKSEFARLAEAVQQSMTDEDFELGNEAVAISVTVVSCAFDHRFTGPDDMLLPMARRMEAVSEAGGNALARVEPGISSRLALDSRQHLLGLLRESLETNSMKVVFQPILATSSTEMVESYQMLPRLKASDGKLIAAADFLPLAREAALLPVLDRWMAVHALRLLRGPLAKRPVRLFLNQSSSLLAEQERKEWLSRQFEDAPALAERLVVELRLDDVMTQLKGARTLFAIAQEHDLSLCLAMVDEHSRWDLLEGGFRPAFVRMSPDFVARLSNDGTLEKRFLELVRPIREQGTRIIMPMIEDPKTAASMWRSGADFMQGNMIQAPEDTIAV